MLYYIKEYKRKFIQKYSLAHQNPKLKGITPSPSPYKWGHILLDYIFQQKCSSLHGKEVFFTKFEYVDWPKYATSRAQTNTYMKLKTI